MTKHWFNAILSSLNYTNVPFPTFKDKFHEVRQVLDAFNEDRMTEIFSPAWVSSLDESMSVWTSKWTCPGWIYVPRKPHPMGNEYHTICCGKTPILYQLEELVEGKERLAELGPSAHTKILAGKLSVYCCISHSPSIQLDIVWSWIVASVWRVEGPCGIKERQCLCVHIDKEVLAGIGPGMWTETWSTHIWKENHWVRLMPFLQLWTMSPSTSLLWGTLTIIPCSCLSTYGGLTINPPQSDTGARRSWKPKHSSTTSPLQTTSYIYRHIVHDHNNYHHDTGSKCGLSLETSYMGHSEVGEPGVRIHDRNLRGQRIPRNESLRSLGQKLPFFQKEACQVLDQQPLLCAWDEGHEEVEEWRTRGSWTQTCTAPVFTKRWTGESWDTSSKTKYLPYMCRIKNRSLCLKNYKPLIWLLVNMVHWPCIPSSVIDTSVQSSGSTTED